MPYIKKQYKELLADGNSPVNTGELNYCFTMLIKEYMKNRNLCYATINDILGALSGAEKEFYRRIVAPYEDQKIKENGDVYEET